MADFRMKLFVLAGMATAFAGMASAQLVCSTATANAVFDRAESNDDQVADTTITCSVPTTNTAVSATTTVNMTVYLSPSVNITSFNVGTSGSPKSEAIAGVTANFAVGGGAPFVTGSVSGNSVTFSSIPIGALTNNGATFTLTITNIKIQSSTVAVGSGIPTGISETIFVSGTNTTPTAITTGSAVAYVTSGLSNIKASGATSNALCTAVTSAAANWTVAFSEAFPNAFKIAGTTAANQALGSWYTNHSETGVAVTGYTNSNQATSGTRIQLIFNNVPSNVTIYVPINIAGTNSGALSLTTSATAAFSQVPASTATGAPALSAAVTIASGSGTAVYEDTTVSTAPSTFSVPVYLVSAAGAVTAPTTAITTTVSFAPIGATSNVPNFINGASTTTVNGSTYSACSTTLLFPYVTNQAGFESGLAISNTGADLLATKNGSPVSSIAGQAGTCLLTFFGNATASSNPPAFTTAAAVAPGTTWTGTLTSVTGGTPGTFGGYMIASCNFLYAHGFTYITYNIGQSSGMAMGYVAFTVNTPRTNTSLISVAGTITGGAGTVTSSPVGVSSSSPEQLGN
jgi:hypothetical protein